MVPNRSVRTDTQAFRSAARASWGWLVARGALALLFGVFAFVFPGAAFVSLAVGFGVYAFVDGITTLIAGFSSRSGGVRWSLVLSGALGVLIGVVTFSLTGAISTVVLLISITGAVSTVSLVSLAGLVQIKRGDIIIITDNVLDYV